MKKRLIIFSVSALLMGFLAGAARAAETDPCQRQRLSSLPIETLPDGRIAVPLTVDNLPFSFMVDTGGVSLTISRNAAEQLRHPVEQTSRALIGVNGTVMNSTITVDSLALGGMIGEKLRIYIEGRDYDTADGTISPDVLKQYDVDIDFAHGTLNLFSKERCRGKVYWTKGDYTAVPIDIDPVGHIRIPVLVDGKKVMATVDTGAVRSLMSLRTAASIGITEKDPDLTLMGGVGQNLFYSYPFHSLDFGGVPVSNPHIAIASDSFTTGLGDDLILGVEILRQLHLYIAYDDKKLYITAADAN